MSMEAPAGEAQRGGASVPDGFDVAAFMEGLGFTSFHRRILALSCLVTFFDGLDFALVAFSLPFIRDAMALDEAMLGTISTATFAGQMIGSLLGAYLADMFGRRSVVIWCTATAALLTFVTGLAETPAMLIMLRLAGGMAIGGLLAPIWSLNIESMPRAMRATSVTIIMLGFSAGGAAAGQVTNLLAPANGAYAALAVGSGGLLPAPGWHAVCLCCGVLTGGLALVLLAVLPESIRWLVARRRPAEHITALLCRFQPGFQVGPSALFQLSDERCAGDNDAVFARMRELFRGWLVWITPLIWLGYFCSSFAIYLKTSFGVLFLEQLGLRVEQAINLSSVGALGGAVLGVALLLCTKRRGPGWIAMAPLLAIPCLLLIGSGAVVGGSLFVPLILAASVLVGAGHAAVIAITSIYYPSAMRATGGGWASFMAKFAAVAAPLVGARAFLGSTANVLDGYLFTALCLAGIVGSVLALACFAKRLGEESAGFAPVILAGSPA